MSRVAFLFAGQGAQVVGMGQSLAAADPSVQALYAEADEILGYSLSTICFEGPTETLNATVHAQPALFVTSLAALRQLRDSSPKLVDRCEFAAGLSLGEYTAMVFAGAMSFEEGLRVVQRRGEAMQAASDLQPSGMLSVLGVSVEMLADLCDEARGSQVLEIANFLCPGNIVVSGDLAACQRLGPLALQAGAMKVVELAVAGAFHTSLMQSAVSPLAEILHDVQLLPPRISVVSNVDAVAHHDADELREILTKQVVQPVQWEESMRRIINEGVTEFVEVGPGRVLRGLLRRIDRKVTCESTLG